MKSTEDRRNDRIVEILTKCNRLGPGSRHGISVEAFRAALDAAPPEMHYREVFVNLARRIMQHERLEHRPQTYHPTRQGTPK